MASVKSLGLHQPAGLQHAITEQLLPTNPPATSYTWEILADEKDGHGVEDELLTADKCVIWCRGGIFRKMFRFDLDKEPIVQAILAYFPTSKDDTKIDGDSKDESKKLPALSKALVVFLRTQAHIYFLSGTSHIVHMPFEVEAAFAGPVGVIIQRKQKDENVAPISFKFPRVPPNSFVSSQLTAFNSSQQTAFSVEGLGKAKGLSLRLSSTLDNLWEAPLEQPESRWPRLVSLTDPLLELGLVVSSQDSRDTQAPKKAAPKKPVFLDAAEEVLHVEQVNIPGAMTQDLSQPLIIAVTVNRETSEYTVWRLTYLEHEDMFLTQQKKPKSSASRRRSSMAPAFASAPGTPVQPNLRDSFGAPLPGKRPRKSEKLEKPIDLVSSLEQQNKEGNGVTRRSSRRVSSMLARADLSASHERAILPDQPLLSGHANSRRHESQGSQYARLSANYNQQIHPSLSSLLAAPFDEGLDEGFHNMGLDDRDFDGLQHEIMFTKLHTVPCNNSNLRYSTSNEPARKQTKVFVLTAPPFAIDGHNQSQLLIGIQDPTEKRLQLLTLELGIQTNLGKGGKTGRDEAEGATVTATVVDRRHAQNVVDSCKLVDGEHSAILILSESMDGRHELSTQAPWSVLTKISLSLLFVDNTRNLQHRGRVLDRDIRQRKSEVIDFTNGSIVGVRHPRQGGIVDVVDGEGRLHQLLIQLQPSSSQVGKVLNMCRSLFPHGLGEHICAGWLHTMQWLQTQDETVADAEWSAVVILLLALFLNIGRTDSKPRQTTHFPSRRRRPASGSFGPVKDSENWKALEAGETANSLGCPAWMMNRGWEWALDEDIDDNPPFQGENGSSPRFMPQHIILAKEYLTSTLGETAFGSTGYMPTSLAKSLESRQKVAVDVFMGLHFLLEEEKLDIMASEFNSPGRADLRVVLCQIARWLKWQGFSTIYELGVQEELDQHNDADMNLTTPIPEPPARPDVIEWIQARLIGDRRAHFLTPADIYYAGSRKTESEKMLDKRWNSILPRTLMFKEFLRLLKPTTSAVQMVEAMRDSGITTLVLDTLPEAILVPLQDAISLCQPHPPTTWSKDLLELVNRSDINHILAPGQHPKPSASKILVSTLPLIN